MWIYLHRLPTLNSSAPDHLHRKSQPRTGKQAPRQHRKDPAPAANMPPRKAQIKNCDSPHTADRHHQANAGSQSPGKQHSDSRTLAPPKSVTSHLQKAACRAILWRTPRMTDRWEDRCLPKHISRASLARKPSAVTSSRASPYSALHPNRLAIPRLPNSSPSNSQPYLLVFRSEWKLRHVGWFHSKSLNRPLHPRRYGQIKRRFPMVRPKGIPRTTKVMPPPERPPLTIYHRPRRWSMEHRMVS